MSDANGNAKTWAQTAVNALGLSGLYAAAWTGRLGWSWFLGALGLSMAWLTPAMLVQALQIYARAVYAPPPTVPPPPTAPPPPGPPSASTPGTPESVPRVESMPPLPPGVFGLLAMFQGLPLWRGIPAFAVMLLLCAVPSCTRAQGDNVGNVLDAVWKVVTATCSGVRTVAPFVEMVRPRPLDATPDDAPDASAD